jgi:hypothetical protein
MFSNVDNLQINIRNGIVIVSGLPDRGANAGAPTFSLEACILPQDDYRLHLNR